MSEEVEDVAESTEAVERELSEDIGSYFDVDSAEDVEPEQPEPEDAMDEAVQAKPVVEADPEAERPDTAAIMDRELQKVQQLRATLERQVQAAQQNPTAENIHKAEKTKSRLDAITEMSSDEIDPYKAVVDVAQEARLNQQRLAELQESVKASGGATNQQLVQAHQAIHELQFKVENPDLAGQYQAIQAAAIAEVDKAFGPPPADAPPAVVEMYRKADSLAMQRAIEAERAKLHAESNETASATTPQVNKPVATNPVKSKSGKARQAVETEDQRTERLLSGLMG